MFSFLLFPSDKIKSAAASGSDILANGQKLRASLDVLLPLMLQCWVEVGPAQLSTDLPGERFLYLDCPMKMWPRNGHGKSRDCVEKSLN